MEWMVSLNCIVLQKKSSLSQEFHYMKCQAFNPFRSSIMAQSPSRETNKTRWWNVDFSPKYNYRAFCKVLYKAIRNHSWKLARRGKYFVFNVWIFYLDFFIGKKLLSALCQAKIFVSLPVRLRILSIGIGKMSTVIPEKRLRLCGLMRPMPK